MSQDRIEIETDVGPWPGWLVAVVKAVRTEIAYHHMVRDLSALTPELLADLGIRRSDIRRVARQSVSGQPPSFVQRGDEPMTTIGSEVWSRAYLLRLGSN